MTLLFTDVVGSTGLWEARPGAPLEAARLLGCADHLIRSAGETFEPLEGRFAVKTRGALEGRLGTEDFQAAYKDGRALTSNDALTAIRQQATENLQSERVAVD